MRNLEHVGRRARQCHRIVRVRGPRAPLAILDLEGERGHPALALQANILRVGIETSVLWLEGHYPFRRGCHTSKTEHRSRLVAVFAYHIASSYRSLAYQAGYVHQAIARRIRFILPQRRWRNEACV